MSYNSTIHKFEAEINENFTFTSPLNIALGVSGGPDSLSLALMTKQWLDKKKGKLVCLTINHNLRPEAKNEALHTTKTLQKHNITHHILNWEGTDKTSNLQNQARDARRHILTSWCQKNNFPYLFLAHTQDDLVETFFIRLFRGSGIRGLSSIKPISQYNKINIIRPLLSFKKIELQQYLTNHKVEWINDPSNNNNKFLRSKIRKLLKSDLLTNILPYELMLDRCSKGIHSIQQAHIIIEEQKKTIASKIVTLHPEGYITISLENFLNLHQELALNILASCLITISGKHSYRPRLNSLKKIYDHIMCKNTKLITLWDCEIKIKKNKIFIYSEIKTQIADIEKMSNDILKWDNRFIIESKNISQITAITRLNSQILKQEKYKNLMQYNSIPKKIFYSLPVIHMNKKTFIPFISNNIQDIKIYFQPTSFDGLIE